MADPDPSFFRARWLRECIHKRKEARETTDPRLKARLQTDAKHALRNAKDYQRQMERELSLKLATDRAESVDKRR